MNFHAKLKIHLFSPLMTSSSVEGQKLIFTFVPDYISFGKNNHVSRRTRSFFEGKSPQIRHSFRLPSPLLPSHHSPISLPPPHALFLRLSFQLSREDAFDISRVTVRRLD